MSTLTPGFFEFETFNSPGTGRGFFQEAGGRYSYHGAPPYIDTEDADASYLQVDPFDVAGQYAAARVDSYDGPTTGTLDLRIQAWASGPASGTGLPVGVHWVVRPNDPAILSPNFAAGDCFPPGGFNNAWVTLNARPDITADMLAALRAGTAIIAVNTLVSGGYLDDAFRVSLLAIESATLPPLRQIQRDDGLGRGTVRARGGTSRQSSIRQRGYF